MGRDLQCSSCPASIFTYKNLCLFSPKPPALSGRYAQYLPQRTRLSRISQVRSHPHLFYGLCPAFYLLEIHPHPLHPRRGHTTVKATAAGGSQSSCPQWRHWCVLLPSHSQVLTTCLMAETLLLLHQFMLTAAEFPPFLLFFPSVPYWDTPSALYWQWFSSFLWNVSSSFPQGFPCYSHCPGQFLISPHFYHFPSEGIISQVALYQLLWIPGKQCISAVDLIWKISSLIEGS